jgi:hypothetical protein
VFYPDDHLFLGVHADSSVLQQRHSNEHSGAQAEWIPNDIILDLNITQMLVLMPCGIKVGILRQG